MKVPETGSNEASKPLNGVSIKGELLCIVVVGVVLLNKGEADETVV